MNFYKMYNVGKLWIGEHAPELFEGLGVVSIIAGVVGACKATLKVSDVLDEHNSKLRQIKICQETCPEEYTEIDANKDRITLTIQTTVNIVKQYIIPVLLIGSGVTSMLWGHHVLKVRLAKYAAAIVALNSEIDGYRKAADNTFFEERESNRYLDKVEKEENRAPVKEVEISRLYTKRPSESATEAVVHLMSVQNMARALVNAGGFLSLNRVYGMLDSGIHPTDSGLVMGWMPRKGNEPMNKPTLFCGNTPLNDDTFEYWRDRLDSNGSLLIDFNIDKAPVYGRLGETA